MYTGPNITRENIILALDSANAKSYIGTGTTWNDISGNGNNATFIGRIINNTETLGVIEMDGYGDYMTLGIKPSLTPSTDISVGLFVRPRDVTSVRGLWTNTTDINTGFTIQIGGISNIGVTINGTLLSTTWSPEANTWYHIIFTHDFITKDNKLYVNGKLEGTLNRTLSYQVNAGTTIGTITPIGISFFYGSISNVRLYNKALTEIDIFRNYNGIKSRYDLRTLVRSTFSYLDLYRRTAYFYGSSTENETGMLTGIQELRDKDVFEDASFVMIPSAVESTRLGVLLPERPYNLFSNSIFAGPLNLPTNWLLGFSDGISTQVPSNLFVGLFAYRFQVNGGRRIFRQSYTVIKDKKYTLSCYVEAVNGEIPVYQILLNLNSLTRVYKEDGVIIPSSTIVKAGKRYSEQSIMGSTIVSNQIRIGVGVAGPGVFDVTLSAPQFVEGEETLQYQKTIDIDFDLVHTRNTTTTRMDSDGFIEDTPYNLIQYSEEFENISWTKLNSTITPNVITSDDDQLIADKIIPNNGSSLAGAYILQNLNVTIGDNIIFSFYAKAAEFNYVSIFKSSYGNTQVVYDLITGVVSFGVGTIEKLQNGWYRCSTSGIATTTTVSGRIYPWSVPGISGFGNGDGVKGIYATKVQLSKNTTLKPYLATTNRLNIPRIDYSTGSAVLLLEPQRTNVITNSQNFTVGWTTLNINTIINNSIISPTGKLDASKFVEDTNNGEHSVYKFEGNAIIRTASIFAKAGERSKFLFYIGPSIYTFDLINGTATGYINSSLAIPSIQKLKNGWFRCSLQATSAVNNTFKIALTDSNGLKDYLGDGISGMYFFGAQREDASYITSYIPTTNATVTRTLDQFTRNNIYTNNIVTSNGGTWLIELLDTKALIRDGVGTLFLGSDTTYNNGDSFSIRANAGFAENLTIEKYVSSVRTGLYGLISTNNKILFKWNGATADVFVNGVKVVTSTVFTGTILENLNGSGNDVPKNIKQIALWSKPLTDAKCIALTQ